MSFSRNKNIIFTDSMLFMNSSLDNLVKNLNYFKYLSSVFNEEQLELVKQKGIYLMNIWTVLKDLKKINYLIIFNSLKDCNISDEEYSRACNV